MRYAGNGNIEGPACDFANLSTKWGRSADVGKANPSTGIAVHLPLKGGAKVNTTRGIRKLEFCKGTAMATLETSNDLHNSDRHKLRIHSRR